MIRVSRAQAVAIVAFAAIVVRPLKAQTCYGTPSRGGLSAHYGRTSFGESIGASGTLGGEHLALTIGGRSVSYSTSTTGFGGDTRLALALGASSFKICPAIGLDYEQRKWTPGQGGTLTTMQLSASVGVGLGYEFALRDNLRLIPFASGRYEFSVSKFDYVRANTETQTTGDTLSGMHAQYGVLLHLNNFYVGVLGERPISSSAASVARAFVGLTYSPRRKK